MSKIERIIDAVTVADILAHFSYEHHERNRFKCFVHNSDRRTMGINKGHVHCFSCGFHGNVIDITKHALSCDTRHAISYIAGVFNLGLNTELTAEQKKAYRLKQQAAEKRKKQKLALENFEKFCLDCIVARREEIETRNPVYTEDILEQKYELKRLEWFFNIIADLDQKECEFNYQYGFDRVEILRNIYKGDITI